MAINRSRPALTTLQHQLLVATSVLNDSVFARSVIFLAHHGPEGGMGFVINQPLQRLAFADVARSMGIEDAGAGPRATDCL